MKKLLLYGRRIWLGFVTPLLLHSPTMAQNEQVSDEVSRIAAALIVVESDYVTPITEATLAIACRDGILKASNALSAEVNTLINESRFEINSFRSVVRLIPRILERPANAVSARMLGDACLQNVFRGLDPRSAYFDRNELEKLRSPSPATTKGSDASSKEVNIRGNVLSSPSVYSRILEGNYLYLHISHLREKTLEQLGDTLRAIDPFVFSRVSGFVLDLRGNQGGLLPAVVGVAATFLPPMAHVVKTEGRNPQSNTSYLSVPSHYRHGRVSDDPLRELPLAVKTLPLWVMVNRHTAAGAEAIAAALQDNKRANIIGEQTFGLGTVQTVRSLSPDTAFKLTTSKLIRPRGGDWDGKGVTPDHNTTQKIGAGVELGSKDDAELTEAIRNFLINEQ